MSKKRIVILGGGTGGTMAANRLRKRFGDDELEIHVVDRDDRHVYQPGLLFVPFGLAQPEKLVRSRRAQLRGGIAFHEGEVESVSLDADEVRVPRARHEGRELARQLRTGGVAREDDLGRVDAEFVRVLLDDAKWESLINEALAADTYYRQRDAS